MINFKKIDDSNLKVCINLSPGDGNDRYVAPNVVSLAQAYTSLVNDECTPIPFAIYSDEEMVGFIQMAYITCEQDDELKEPIYEIWRFMIDHTHQNKGYGKAALEKALVYLKDMPYGKANKVLLSYVPGNEHASGLYTNVGFVETGEVDEGEIVMAYDLNN